MTADKPYLDVPGTTIFDAERSQAGYQLNQFCRSLMQQENREAFLADEQAYLDRFPLSDDQKAGVLDRDLNRLIELGGNIYFLAKIGATDGRSYLQIVASMTDLDEDAYRAMMLAGGRSIEGNRSVGDWAENPDPENPNPKHPNSGNPVEGQR